MRTIKFRVYDKEKKEYVKGPIILSDNGVFVDSEHYAVEQFTGLFDKNGKEIYEGDIVRTNLYTRASGKTQMSEPKVVYWDIEKAGFETNKKGSYSSGMFYDEYEVIGNVMENPELLLP